jgi:hypothetical protein
MTTYYKILNEAEYHRGYQYNDGLNILKEAFNDDPTKSCCKGGFYYTDISNIFEFIEYGIYVREVIIPLEARIVKDPSGNKWRTNQIILGKKHDLRNVETFKYLVDKGANIRNHDDLLKWCAERGYLEIICYLVEQGASVKNGNSLLIWSSFHGHLNVVQYLVEQGADIHAFCDLSLCNASYNGKLEVVKYLVEQGADIYIDCNRPLRLSIEQGHLNIVKYFVELGININANDDKSIRWGALFWSATHRKTDIVKYLIDKGADVEKTISLCKREYRDETATYLSKFI